MENATQNLPLIKTWLSSFLDTRFIKTNGLEDQMNIILNLLENL